MLNGRIAAAFGTGRGHYPYRFVGYWVFCAIFIARQVMAIFVTEAVSLLHLFKSRGQCSFQLHAAVQQLATVITAQPQPQRMLGRWHINALIAQRRKSPQWLQATLHSLHNRWAQPNHSGLAIQLCQLLQRLRQCLHIVQGKKQMPRQGWNRFHQNARLTTHNDS